MGKRIRNLFFLGAGASHAELERIGSERRVLQKDLLPQYFLNNQNSDRVAPLTSFFSHLFKMDFNSGQVDFPSFEDTLAMIEISLYRSDMFKSLSNLHEIKSGLLYGIAETLAINLGDIHPPNIHHDLLQKLDSHSLIERSAFISLNYDIIIDSAMLRYHEHSGNGKKIQPDYGFEIPKSNQRVKFTGRKIPLFKLHGSLNWLFCPTCYSIKHLGDEKLDAFFSRTHGYPCSCQSRMIPILIPPTYLKDISNPYLQKVWFQAEKKLQGVENVFFIGYALPDADLQIKYLLKRLQINRNEDEQFNVYVANRRGSDISNYERFLGVNVPKNLRMDFNEFVRNIDFSNPQPANQ